MATKTATRTLKLGPQVRFFTIERRDIDEESQTVPICFSSETPVNRWWGNEILDHTPSAVRLGRLRNGAAILADHDWDCQLGVIENATIDTDRKGRCVARYSKNNPRAVQEFRDIVDGIRTNVSVGYFVHSVVLESEVDGVATYRIIDWEPFEVSTVAVPADTNVGVGRSLRADEQAERDITVTVTVCGEDEDETDPPEDGGEPIIDQESCDPQSADKEKRKMEINVNEVKDQGRKEEQHRAKEIMAISARFPQLAEAARTAISDGTTLEDFRINALERVANAVPVQVSSDLGMNAREIKQYSIVRAMNQIANNQRLEGIEREASEATAKIVRREAKGFFIPQDVMKRALSVGDSTKGGFSVTDQLLPDMIELLRNKTLVSRLGARTLSGLVGQVAIPRISGGATAYWLPESGTVPATDQGFGQLGLVPHRLVGDTAYSKELLIQSSIDIEAFVRDDLMRVLAIEKDRAAINGLGANGEPVGILNTTGIGSVTFGAAATWSKVISFETAVANSNADVGQMAYLSTPNVRGAWKGTPKVTNQAFFLWEKGNAEFGEVNGYPAAATKQVPSEKVIFGNFNDLILAEWAGIDVVVDPYSLKKAGQVEITVTLWADIGVRHAGSFAVSSDSGAQ